MYMNGHRSHPIAFVDDRRVRPYQMEAGESAFYSADGSGQMVYHKADGVYMLTRDGDSENKGDGKSIGASDAKNPQQGQSKERFVSLRHVNKQKQPRKKQPGQDQQKFKHEGDSVNVEQRLTAGQIQYYDGATTVGHYDKGNKDWLHHDGKGATHSMRADKDHSHIKHEGAHIWVDGACWSSMPIQIKGDDCS
jgi:hypothetical protein